MADRVTGRRAHSLLRLRVLVTDGAGQAGVEGALPVGEGIVHTLLTHRVVFVFAVREHALARRTHRAQLALSGPRVQEVVVVADADGVVGVGAGRLHPHEAGALGAGPALLRVTVDLRVGLTCRREDRSKETRRKSEREETREGAKSKGG